MVLFGYEPRIIFFTRVTNPEPYCIKTSTKIAFPEARSLSLILMEKCNFLHMSAEDMEFIKERSRKNLNCKNRTKYAL